MALIQLPSQGPSIVKIAMALVVALTTATGWSQRRNPESLQDVLSREEVADLVRDSQIFGDPVRGALSFFKPELNCARCHDSNSGRHLGPNLGEVREVSEAHLIESVLHPSKQIKEGHESVIVQMIDGQSLTGILVGASETEIVIDRIQETHQPLRLRKDDVDDWHRTKSSSMPEQLVNQLADRQQFLDLICYLSEIARRGLEREKELRPADSIFAVSSLPEYESRIDHRKLIESPGKDALDRGAETYRLRCASCHGTKETEGSLPTSLRFHAGSFKNGNDPLSMYGTLTHGYGMMNAQRWMVPREKYEVIHFIREIILKEENRRQYFEVGASYLENLPEGDTFGPKPLVRRPWTTMDYGPSLNNTIEVSNDGSNIAQKGIAIRLDNGPGGVESGRNWILYDHDTMRVAGAWHSGFIDFNGIHFNGVHGRHPRITGQLIFENPVAPGWGKPADHSFLDERMSGRDGKRYGPLPRDWLHYKGLYRFGNKTILKYSVGESVVYESPGLTIVDGQPVVMRQFRIGSRNQDLAIQLLRTEKRLCFKSKDGRSVGFRKAGIKAGELSYDTSGELIFDGTSFAQLNSKEVFDISKKDFTVYAEIKTGADGTIFSQTQEGENWVQNGMTFFIRDRRLHFDIGWVGVVESTFDVCDGKWRKVAVSWQAETGKVEFRVDGEHESVGTLKPKSRLTNFVQRIGFTNSDFPNPSIFKGEMRNVKLFSRRFESDMQQGVAVNKADVTVEPALLKWNVEGKNAGAIADSLFVNTSLHGNKFEWITTSAGDLRLKLKAGPEPVNFVVNVSTPIGEFHPDKWHESLQSSGDGLVDLEHLSTGGPANWPQKLKTKVNPGAERGPFQVDVLKRPVDNPWNDRMRLTGVDFFPNGSDAAVCCWDGSVYRVYGIDEQNSKKESEITWRRIAAGLFQPLGIRIVDDQIYVCCRDQIVRLHDLNNDDEIDYYENFNNDHQVTEHFHEFAMGLQTDDEGNFYYAKSARHALEAIVPHHGTLLKVDRAGEATTIVANGFRAANGVCLNPDGTFFVTDQEGHWNPKNRINWVQEGGFYGNMLGYHDNADSSDDGMDPPLCWITNAFDRSPAELLWVTSKHWKPLQGALLNFSYGNGKLFVVPHEKVKEQFQGGVSELPMPVFPTGIMRGRFHPVDGQLYCCGMFAWSGNQQQPGGFYRVRYTGEPLHVPVEINAKTEQLTIRFSGKIDPASASDIKNFRVSSWDIKRSSDYGSDHYNTKELKVTKVVPGEDRLSVILTVPGLKPTRCMEIKYSIRTEQGERLQGTIHNTIHRLGE